MGTTESSIVDSARARPGLLLVVLLGGLLLVDLAAKLAGFSILPIGEAISIDRLGSNLWNGVVIGLVIGLAGIGLSMTYSILSFANFSHGDLLSTGAFTGWGVAFLIAGFGDIPVRALLTVGDAGSATPGDIGAHILSTPVAILVGLLVAFAATAAVALALDRAFYKPMRDRDGISILIASIGAALIVRYVIQFVYGSDRRGVTAAIDASNLAFDPLGLSVNAHELTIVVAAIGLMLAMHFMLQRTKLGTAMRAMADNKDLALVTGIPAERVVTATWIIGGGLAGASGYLYVLLRGTIQFDFGWLLLLLIFAAVILGGIGSVYGAIAGGLVIGIVFTTSTVWIPSDFNQAAAFAVMITMLLLRPEGLFGGVSTA
ncbi:branched-chain amino acid ABC transporter permease [Halorubrum lacusprofundi]|jgi:branched-chain amino acid transport system permease protein|uniref:Inner-membrane translocator n=1 Tax=Halorubrum lacusprofundi (strain ATCC 49239 / DSM 5036 / JCM 8891 / ACAM 34) TaxID=416348 RepID=B9LR21_HALLT|nr:branched-chain amino acid ABC transporter permease [Halorubrum lacusprofundi]ACM57675.1 inner-membrane translocator [Halorubrum lacusprofundi ATCC 49239]MCG1005729.1 branched-chain amino acid ABC transporter permease [Halorubrum lacusprofundi]